MTIIHSLRNTKVYKKFDGEIGLEIETETRQPYQPPQFTFWNVHGDGSLRDFGQEYVLKQPVKYGKELDTALAEWSDKTKEIPFIKDSISTSVHVHVNMLNETWKTLGNYLTLYTLFENLLIRFSGPDRLSNLFCLPICDAEDTYKNMALLFKNVEAKLYKGIMFGEGNVKYAACNLAALGMYGSIEHRSFRGVTDIKLIAQWVDILMAMLGYARNPKLDPKMILGSWKETKKELLSSVFKGLAKELDSKDAESLIDRNLWYAQNVAYPIKDWNILDAEAKIPEFKPKQKELETEAGKLYAKAWDSLDTVEQEQVLFNLRMAYHKKHGLKSDAVKADWADARVVREPRVNLGLPEGWNDEIQQRARDDAAVRAREILNRQNRMRNLGGGLGVGDLNINEDGN